MLRIILLISLSLPFWVSAQNKSISYELKNEIGTYKLSSLTFSHQQDNEEGITYVTDKTGTDTLYHIDQFLNGFVGLSNDGKTIAHVQTEKKGEPLAKMKVTFYRDGKKFDKAEFGKFLKYELDEAVKRHRLPKSGWLRNDSLYHKMAGNAFYVTEDKLFLSSEGPLLHVFDMNQLFLIYTGNGANHFLQNYYSIPNPPLRTEFDSREYYPEGFPDTKKGELLKNLVANALNTTFAIPEEATLRIELEFLVEESGNTTIRKADVYRIKANEFDKEKTEVLNKGLKGIELSPNRLPPNHPAWIFNGNVWLK